MTAGKVMHGSKLPLPVWFWAYLMVTHSNGISALQLLRQLGLGSYKTAWLLCAKLRRAMVAPDRNLVGTTPAGCASRRSPTSPQSAARLRQGQCRRRGNRKTDGWSGYVGVLECRPRPLPRRDGRHVPYP